MNSPYLNVYLSANRLLNTQTQPLTFLLSILAVLSLRVFMGDRNYTSVFEWCCSARVLSEWNDERIILLMFLFNSIDREVDNLQKLKQRNCATLKFEWFLIDSSRFLLLRKRFPRKFQVKCVTGADYVIEIGLFDRSQWESFCCEGDLQPLAQIIPVFQRYAVTRAFVKRSVCLRPLTFLRVFLDFFDVSRSDAVESVFQEDYWFLSVGEKFIRLSDPWQCDRRSLWTYEALDCWSSSMHLISGFSS